MEIQQLVDYVSMPLARLDERGKELSYAIREGYLNPERKAQVQHELGQISFELYQRHLAGEMEIVHV